MPTSSKPRHKRRVKSNARASIRTQPWKTFAAFDVIDELLRHIEKTGCVDTQQGKPVFKPNGDHCWYEIGPSLRGLTEAFEIHGRRVGRAVDTAAVERFIVKLEAGSPVFAGDIAEVRVALDALRRISYGMTIADGVRMVRAAQIAFELDAAGVQRSAP